MLYTNLGAEILSGNYYLIRLVKYMYITMQLVWSLCLIESNDIVDHFIIKIAYLLGRAWGKRTGDQPTLLTLKHGLLLFQFFFVYENGHLFSKKKKCRQGRKKQRSNRPGQLNFYLGLVKIVVLWPSGLVPMVLWGCHFFRFLLLYLKDYICNTSNGLYREVDHLLHATWFIILLIM